MVSGDAVCKDVVPLVSVPAVAGGWVRNVRDACAAILCSVVLVDRSKEELSCGDKGVVFPGGVYSFAGLE